MRLGAWRLFSYAQRERFRLGVAWSFVGKKGFQVTNHQVSGITTDLHTAQIISPPLEKMVAMITGHYGIMFLASWAVLLKSLGISEPRVDSLNGRASEV